MIDINFQDEIRSDRPKLTGNNSRCTFRRKPLSEVCTGKLQTACWVCAAAFPTDTGSTYAALGRSNFRSKLNLAVALSVMNYALKFTLRLSFFKTIAIELKNCELTAMQRIIHVVIQLVVCASNACRHTKLSVSHYTYIWYRLCSYT